MSMDSLPPVALDAHPYATAPSRTGALRTRIARLLIVIAPLVVGVAQARAREGSRSSDDATALASGRERAVLAPRAPRVVVPARDTWPTIRGEADEALAL